MEPIYEFVSELFAIPQSTAAAFVLSFIYFAAIWSVRYLLLKLVYMHTDSPSARYVARKATFYLAFAAMFIAALLVWFEDISTLSMATYLGLISAGLAIALRDMFANLAGWTYILMRRPLEVGDRVEIAGVTGDVVDIAAFEFAIVEIGNWVPADQSTGRLVFIPNGTLFTKPLFNYTRGFNFIWEDLSLTITFESNWRKAKELLMKAVEEVAGEFVPQAEEEIKKATSRYYIMYRKLTPIVYTSVVQNGIQLSVRYVFPPRRRRTVSQAVWERVLAEFEKQGDITFAYTPYRAYISQSPLPERVPPPPAQ
ncbi:MAG: mechanosensitive ion channel [Planctomycetota bacterium]